MNKVIYYHLEFYYDQINKKTVNFDCVVRGKNQMFFSMDLD